MKLKFILMFALLINSINGVAFQYEEGITNIPVALNMDLYKQDQCVQYSLNSKKNTYLSEIKNQSKASSPVSILYRSEFSYQPKSETNHSLFSGDVYALFVDQLGRFREDSNHDFKLTELDHIVEFNSELGEGYFNRIVLDLEGSSTKNENIPISKLNPLWRVSDFYKGVGLSQRQYEVVSNNRFMFTYLESKVLNFNYENLIEYKEVFDFESKEEVINFIRGDRSELDYASQKFLFLNVIENTLQVVGQNFEQALFEDLSYKRFMNMYQNRRNMVYIATNDGVLHGINAGFSNKGLNELTKQLDFNSAYEIGSELWSFVPKESFKNFENISKNYDYHPFIKANTQYLDVKIFEDTQMYPGGWGSVLLYSLYDESITYLIDVTNPESAPVILDEINLKFSSDIKSIKRNQEDDTDVELMFLSNNSQSLILQLYNLKSKELKTFEKNIIVNDIAGVAINDIDLDGLDDVLYISLNVANGSKIIRFHLDDGSFSELIDLDMKVSAKPIVHLDEKNKVWIFQGTGKLDSISDIEWSKFNQLEHNYFMAIKESLDGSLNKDFAKIEFSSLVDTSDISVLPSFQLKYENNQPLINDKNIEVTDLSMLNQLIESKNGWRFKAKDSNNTKSALIINPAFRHNQTLMVDQFLPVDDICHSTPETLLRFVDFKLGIVDLRILSSTQMFPEVSSSAQVIKNEIGFASFTNKSILLNYTQKGVQIILGGTSGELMVGFLKPATVIAKRLRWKQMY